MAAYSYYSQNLPDPKVLLTALAFDQQTTVYDRSGQTELARLGERKREVVTFKDIPPEAIDAFKRALDAAGVQNEIPERAKAETTQQLAHSFLSQDSSTRERSARPPAGATPHVSLNPT